jgi:hypothetical protein
MLVFEIVLCIFVTMFISIFTLVFLKFVIDSSRKEVGPMKKSTVIAELKYLKTKLYGRRIHELINSVAVIEAICSETSEEEISPIFQCIVEKELSKIREAIRR